MKKVFSMLFSVIFLSGAFAENQEVVSIGKEKIDKKDLPEFADIQSICENKYVQSEVIRLQSEVLKLLRTINNEKTDSETIRGNKKDIDQAKRRIDYLVSLESNLQKADTLERVKNMLGLNFSGKEEVQKALDLIRAVENADVLEKIRIIPRINQSINGVIDKYETLEKMVKTADSIDKIKNIPGIDPKSLAQIQKLEEQVAEIKNLNDVKNVVNNAIINSDLKNQVASLINLEANFRNADTLDKLKRLPNVNKQIIEYIDSQISENQELNKMVGQLQKENNELVHRLEEVTTDNEKERRFSTRLIGAILRALIGFDYRNAVYDFEKSKDLGIIEKSALIAASKDKFSYFGGTERDVYTITNGLYDILKTLVSNKNWMRLAEPIKEKLEKIGILCKKKLNSDADIIKLNVDYAANIVSNLLEGAKRPPRDNVKNFELVEEQKSARK
ncbi:MAG: hypothetical protein J6P84_01405 [Alphaproteobacteria bacterium]|nr:hypothetical protein [Alphaproteobacteria bacterium]